MASYFEALSACVSHPFPRQWSSWRRGTFTCHLKRGPAPSGPRHRRPGEGPVRNRETPFIPHTEEPTPSSLGLLINLKINQSIYRSISPSTDQSIHVQINQSSTDQSYEFLHGPYIGTSHAAQPARTFATVPTSGSDTLLSRRALLTRSLHQDLTRFSACTHF